MFNPVQAAADDRRIFGSEITFWDSDVGQRCINGTEPQQAGRHCDQCSQNDICVVLLNHISSEDQA